MKHFITDYFEVKEVEKKLGGYMEVFLKEKSLENFPKPLLSPGGAEATLDESTT